MAKIKLSYQRSEWQKHEKGKTGASWMKNQEKNEKPRENNKYRIRSFLFAFFVIPCFWFYNVIFALIIIRSFGFAHLVFSFIVVGTFDSIISFSPLSSFSLFLIRKWQKCENKGVESKKKRMTKGWKLKGRKMKKRILVHWDPLAISPMTKLAIDKKGHIGIIGKWQEAFWQNRQIT